MDDAATGPPPASRQQRRPPRFYYGWVIVGVILLSALASAVQINPTIGVFVKPMAEEFGWSRSAMAGAVTVGTVLGGLLALGVGPVIDRFGARWVLFTGFLLTGAALVALGGISRLWQFYALTIVTRMMLQGVINLTNQTVVAKWFVVQRGRMVALASLGQRLGGGVMPYIAQSIIEAHSWRAAARGIGVLAWGLTLAPVLLWLRRQPGDMGLLPDGRTAPEAGAGRGPRRPRGAGDGSEVSFTLREALRTRTFYILLGVFSLTSFVGTGVNFNLVPYLTDRGLDGTQAVTVLLVWSLVGVPASMAAGLLAERLPIRPVMVVSHAGIAVGIALMAMVSGFWMGVLFGVVHGTFFAAMMLVQPLALAEYYGPASLGAIRWFVIPWQMTANALGPLTAALVFDATGSYALALNAYVALSALLALSLVAATRPAARG